jgi:hypothetical protein
MITLLFISFCIFLYVKRKDRTPNTGWITLLLISFIYQVFELLLCGWKIL